MKRIEMIRFARNGAGLVAAPSVFLMRQVGMMFAISVSTSENLVIHNMWRWQEIVDHINGLPLKQRQMLRPLLVHSAKIWAEGDGSWTLPRSLADTAHIVDRAWLCIPEPSDGSALEQKSLILTVHCP